MSYCTRWQDSGQYKRRSSASNRDDGGTAKFKNAVSLWDAVQSSGPIDAPATEPAVSGSPRTATQVCLRTLDLLVVCAAVLVGGYAVCVCQTQLSQLGHRVLDHTAAAAILFVALTVRRAFKHLPRLWACGRELLSELRKSVSEAVALTVVLATVEVFVLGTTRDMEDASGKEGPDATAVNVARPIPIPLDGPVIAEDFCE